MEPCPERIAARGNAIFEPAGVRRLHVVYVDRTAPMVTKAVTRADRSPDQKRGLHKVSRSHRERSLVRKVLDQHLVRDGRSRSVAVIKAAAWGLFTVSPNNVTVTHRSPNQNLRATPQGARSDVRWCPMHRRCPAADAAFCRPS